LRGRGEKYAAVSPKLASALIRIIASIPENRPAVQRILARMDVPRRFENARALQQDALRTALRAYDGAQAAHELILDRYLTHTDWTSTPTNWIHFVNIGDWGPQVVERSSITEFLQYANGINSAAYYHVFKDANGKPLDGSNPRGYVLTFPKGQLPEAMRFWSVTAYTPEAIELVDNPADKYAVASYTPGLQPNPNTEDGPLSIYMARQLPAGVPIANWLPIPPGAFNIMLRVYGPEGSVADNTYVPPGIQKR